jgi:hypothetical protein
MVMGDEILEHFTHFCWGICLSTTYCTMLGYPADEGRARIVNPAETKYAVGIEALVAKRYARI